MTKQILVVDDDSAILQSVQLVLQSADYRVEIARSGVEALDILEHYQPDLIVSDYNMPYMSGDALFRVVKQNPKHKIIPFIFLTANEDLPTKVRSLQNGATDYITKPFSKDELLARVATHIAYRDTLTDTFQQELERLRVDLLNNVSHELRTPLSVIMGYVGILLENMHDAPGMQQQFLQSTYEASLRLKKVIENLLFLTSAQSGRLKYQPQSFRAETLLATLVEYYRREFDDEIILNLPSQRLPLLLADHNKVKMALDQLIDNALKFKREGQKASVTVSLLATETELKISVQDKGIGLSQKQITRIFDPLFQADASSTRNYGGTGAGLKIVQLVAELHQGRVEVESQEGEGSTFTLVLPLASGPESLGV